MINFIKESSKEERYRPGQVGNRVNPKQKIRQDLYFHSPPILSKIDNYIYENLFEEVKKNFGEEILYREPWKIGFYNSADGGFYNLHTDDARETKYRKISMVCALSDPNDYEGGYLHFPALKKEFKFKKGDVIVFDSSIMHGVTPITSGERYVLIGFFFTHEGRQIREHIRKIPQTNTTWCDLYKPILSNLKLTYPTDRVKVQMGDIDYSDINEHPWTDQDDYFFEGNNSDTLFVSFAGMGWRDSIPTFNFYNFMKKYDNIDKLFLRDTGPPGARMWCCRYYLLGFRHNKRGFESSIELIRELTTKKKYKKIVAFGCSAGGYAAILYGQMLDFTHIIAFNPQTTLTELREEWGDKYNCPANAKFLRGLRKDSPIYQKALDLKNFVPFKNKVSIHYCNESNGGCDKKHAEYVKCDNCDLTEYDSKNHLLALDLKHSGDLKFIIENAIYGIDFDEIKKYGFEESKEGGEETKEVEESKEEESKEGRI
tara:strand:- start:2881 stop:4335 length:1455 start_codon:yes stop_codon:yes gene_type:complete